MALYKGYNTVNNISPKTRIEDADLIRQDIINHFNIRKGEKLMRPNFGTIIWDSIFEPLTDDLKDAIVSDVNNIVNHDPRVQAERIIVDEYSQGLVIEARLKYTNTNQIETLKMQFDQGDNKLRII